MRTWKLTGVALALLVAAMPSFADDDPDRAMATDRPGKSHSAITVEPGRFQLEGDVWNHTWDHWSRDNTSTRSTTFLNTNLKLGVTSFMELDVMLPVFNQLDTRGAGAQHVRGYGDTYLGGKVNFFGNDGGDQSFGAVAFVKVPTAARGLGNNMVEGTVNFPFTTVLPNKFSLTVEPALGLFRNLNKQGYEADYQMIFNLSRPITETVTVAVELALDYSGDHNYGPRHTFDTSIQWQITPTVQVDAGAYFGLTKAATDFNPYVGISFRF